MNILTLDVSAEGKLVFDDLKSLVDLKCVVKDNRYYFQIPNGVIRSGMITMKKSEDLLFPQITCDAGGLVVELKTLNGQIQKGNFILWIAHLVDPLGLRADKDSLVQATDDKISKFRV